MTTLSIETHTPPKAVTDFIAQVCAVILAATPYDEDQLYPPSLPYIPSEQCPITGTLPSWLTLNGSDPSLVSMNIPDPSAAPVFVQDLFNLLNSQDENGEYLIPLESTPENMGLNGYRAFCEAQAAQEYAIRAIMNQGHALGLIRAAWILAGDVADFAGMSRPS